MVDVAAAASSRFKASDISCLRGRRGQMSSSNTLDMIWRGKWVTSEKGQAMQEESERRRGGERNQWTLLGCAHVLIRSLLAVYVSIGRLARVSTEFLSRGSTRLRNTKLIFYATGIWYSGESSYIALSACSQAETGLSWTWLDLTIGYKRPSYHMFAPCLSSLSSIFLSNTFHI